jgi:7-cyano-7-deazaguanine synthase
MLFAAEQCKKKNIERQTTQVHWAKPTRPIPLDRVPQEMRSSVSPAFLPGRNTVFLSLAAAYAAGIAADEVWTGINSVDFSGYATATILFRCSVVQRNGADQQHRHRE